MNDTGIIILSDSGKAFHLFDRGWMIKYRPEGYGSHWELRKIDLPAAFLKTRLKNLFPHASIQSRGKNTKCLFDKANELCVYGNLVI